MSSTLAIPERTTALEIQINMMANKINILEAEIERLRRDMDSKNGALLTGPELPLPPHIFVEHGNDTVVIARQAVKACWSKYMFYNKIADALQLQSPPKRSFFAFTYPSMKIEARFDHEGASFATSSGWHEIAEWDESFLGVLAIATRLKVILLPKDQ